MLRAACSGGVALVVAALSSDFRVQGLVTLVGLFRVEGLGLCYNGVGFAVYGSLHWFSCAGLTGLGRCAGALYVGSPSHGRCAGALYVGSRSQTLSLSASHIP